MIARWVAAIALCLCVCFGCTPANTASAPSAQQDAANALKLVNDAWEASATACAAAEDQGLVATGKCGPVFVPIYDSIVLAGNLVDTWDAAAQEQLPCLLKQIMTDLVSGEKVLTDAKLTIPPAVLTAQAGIEAFAASLCLADAGADQ